VFRRNIRRKSPPCGGILFASTEVMHRGRNERHGPLWIDIRNSYKICTEKRFSITRRLLIPRHSARPQSVTATEIE